MADIRTLKPYEKNTKKHPKRQVAQVAASIKEFGFNQPIVVDKDNVIIVGHGRYEAAKLLGLTEVPVIVADLPKEKANAYRLADNKLNESEWDMNLVIEELKSLDLDMVELTGFSTDLLIEPDANDDVVPELPEEPTSKLGDLYILGNHRVLCGDSTKIEDVERLMDGKKADMVFTDPPYNVDYVGKTKNALKIKNDKKDDGEFFQFLYDAFTNMATFTKAGGAAYITHADSEGLNFRKAFIDSGFQMKQCIIWNKNVMVMGRQDYHWKHEPILYGWQKGEAHSWYGSRNQTTVWDIPRPSRSEDHPTMKPVELITNALANSSKSEDIILDLFLGSGSTLIAAEKTGRICYGMELDCRYMDVIVKRWEDYTGKDAVKL